MEEKLTNSGADNIASAVSAVLALPSQPELRIPSLQQPSTLSSTSYSSPPSSSSPPTGNLEELQVNQGIAQAAWLWKDTRISYRDLLRQEEIHHQQVINHQQKIHHLSPQTSQLISTPTITETLTKTTTAATSTTTLSSPPSFINQINDYIFQYVNLNVVRKMIAQNLTEILFICVIITYLVFYFSHISRKPKLIGNTRSKFVKFIRKNLDDTLGCRFNPLIYFWGTNPQTALFGYLQGQTSTDEMPRSHFQRQYLYVSDAQYLTSNVDLSEHYNNINDETIRRNENSVLRKSKNKHRRDRAKQVSIGEKKLEEVTQNKKHHFLQLQVDPASMQQQHKQQVGSSIQLTKNICLALGNILADHSMNDDGCLEADSVIRSIKDDNNHLKSDITNYSTTSSTATTTTAETEVETEVSSAIPTTTSTTKELDMSSSKSGSSSDSGVFPGHSSSTSSSTSSLADVTIDPDKCVCKIRYEAETQFEPENFQITNFKRHYNDDERYNSLRNSEILTSSSASSANSTTNYPSDILPKSSSQTKDAAAAFIPREHYEFGQCALDWHIGSHKNYHKNKLVALISAGMTTGSDKKYVTDTVTTLEQLGYEVCVFIRRGVGGLKLLSTKFFSPAKWHDFEAAIQSVRQQRPDARLVAIGFSFGSIELCRYLSMSGKRTLVDAAFLISCPFDPEAGGINMRKRTLNRKIDAYLARNLGKQLYQAMFSNSNNSTTKTSAATTTTDIKETTQLSNHNGSIVNLATLTKIKSLVEFEKDYNRVLQNYPSSKAYGDDSRLHDHLGAITTPTLCLSSEDDFMAPLKLLPLDQIKANKNLCMILTRRGGHMAFIDGLLWPKKPYFAQRIIGRYMEAVKESLLLNTGCPSTSSPNVADISSINNLTKNPNSFDFYNSHHHHHQRQHKQSRHYKHHKLDSSEHLTRQSNQENLFVHQIQNPYEHHITLEMPDLTEISV